MMKKENFRKAFLMAPVDYKRISSRFSKKKKASSNRKMEGSFWNRLSRPKELQYGQQQMEQLLKRLTQEIMEIMLK